MTDDGIGKVNEKRPVVLITIITFISLALYNVIELHFIILGTFKKRSGLYFWSFCISTWGIAIYSIGFLLKNIQAPVSYVLYVFCIIVGWCSMVTGQSVVLYSRLHLILRDRKSLRLVLIMICVDAIICHVPTTVLSVGSNSNNPDPFVFPYSVYEKVQVTIFFIQELIISGLYILQTIKMLRPEGNIRNKTSRQLMSHLIYVNIIIVILDITILALEYSGMYDIQTAYKGLVYSVKLKLEFSILNRLVDFTRKGGHSTSSNTGDPKTQRSVHLTTFNDIMRRKASLDGPKSVGYAAYISSDHVKGAGSRTTTTVAQPNDAIIVSTTRVAVHTESEERDARNGGFLELDGTGRKEETASDLGSLRVDDDNREISSSSSEADFARQGF